jgi:hypothetical protein
MAHKTDQDREHYLSVGMAIGMIMFMPLGFLFILLDNPGLLGIGPAMGIAVGLAIGEQLYRRSQQQPGGPK